MNRPLLFAAVLLLAGPAGAVPPPLPQNLIPANLNSRNDALGHQWYWDQAGRVQSGYFNGAFALSVNGRAFQQMRSQPMMTADTGEMVFTGAPMGGLEVTRRVKLDMTGATVRYLEILHNPGTTTITAGVSINAAIGYHSSNQMVITDTGTPGGVLGKKDSGIVLFIPQNQGPASLVMFLANPRSRMKPTVQVNQSNITFAWTVKVPPGKAVILGHGLGQRNLPIAPDVKGMAVLMAPFQAKAWTADLPAAVRRLIANLGSGGFGFEDEPGGAGLASLDVKPGPADLLAIGPQTRLAGTAACGSISLETRYGKLQVPWQNVAAVVGEKGPGRQPRVFLRDGQVFAGKLAVENFHFTMQTGMTVEPAVASLDRLVMRSSPEDGKPPAGAVALLETVEGERIALAQAAGQKLSAVTPWGRRDVALDEVLRLWAGEDHLGHRLLLHDGSRLFTFLEGSTVTLTTLAFGPQQFTPIYIRRLTTTQGMSADSDAAAITAPHVMLSGENLLVGQVELSALHFLAIGQNIPVPPGQIRHLRCAGDDSERLRSGAMFEADLWDGSTVSGRLAELVLPVRSSGGLVYVPVRDLTEAHVPAPVVPDAVRSRIAELIRDLGHAEFEKRKAASAALATLGQMAKPQLSDTLQQTTDPEVRRRLQALLEELKE